MPDDVSDAQTLRLPDFSSAYEKIIQDEDDLEGLIAYSLYKAQKREYVIHNSIPVGDPRIKEYHHDLNTGRISSLRMQAERLLQNYANVIVSGISEKDRQKAASDEIVRLLTTVVDDRADGLINLVTSSSKNVEEITISATVWWKTVLYGALSSFVFALILTAFGFIAWTNPFNSIPQQTKLEQG